MEKSEIREFNELSMLDAAEKWIKKYSFRRPGDQLQALVAILMAAHNSGQIQFKKAAASMMDHTEMELEYIHEDTGKPIGTEWLDNIDVFDEQIKIIVSDE